MITSDWSEWEGGEGELKWGEVKWKTKKAEAEKQKPYHRKEAQKTPQKFQSSQAQKQNTKSVENKG